MNILDSLFQNLIALIPSGIAIAAVLFAFVLIRAFLNKRFIGLPNQKFRHQMILLILSFIGLLIIILALPLKDSTTGQLLSLIGILLSAAIALSATTFVGNIMAGMMIRAVRNLRPGDFIQVNDFFGRISEIGLFHVEIQCEDSDLITMPALYLVTNPVKVTRKTGTIVWAEVSLGYDVSRIDIEEALLDAAKDTGLNDAFVQILKLGDFSINYRVSGVLTEVKSLLSSRSKLRTAMLDRLHQCNIEIVSPAFMNQRVLDKDYRFISKAKKKKASKAKDEVKPEDLVFDKADEAESIEKLLSRINLLKEKQAKLKDELEEDNTEEHKNEIKHEIESLKERIDRIAQFIADKQNKE